MRRCLLCCLVSVFAVMLLACSGTVPKTETKKKPDPIPRDAFEALVKDKSKEEVMASVGRPDDTHDFSEVEAWTYRSRTVNPVTLKPDWYASVRFSKKTGKVVEVLY